MSFEFTSQTKAEEEKTEAGTSAPLSTFALELLDTNPFSGYVLGDCLASDEYSAVFKAQDKNMDRTVSLKALLAHPERDDAVETFFSQAGSVARVRHPRLARGLDAGRGGRAFFMAHEFVRGESLGAKLARRQTGRLTEKESLAFVAELAQTLQDLFDAGQNHGDLRPERILFVDGGQLKLLGLGFAWTVAWWDDTAAYAVKPDYLPPERIADELNIDVRGDLYSLGALWWKAILAEPVFKGNTPEETLDMHLRQKPVPPREVDPRLSAATSQLILWLLEKDRDARPRTPKEFLRKLSSHPLLEKEKQEEAAVPAPTPVEEVDSAEVAEPDQVEQAAEE